ncbi:MAG: biotin-dependent carboxyltransferase family protein, partial [Deefgea sp.]
MRGQFKVIRAGVQSTIQDAGRLHAAQWGVPQSGAADPLGFAIANMLLGNSADAACIEITMGGLQLRFLAETDFALAGADCAASLDEKAILPYSRQRAHAGQTLKLQSPARGLRTYMALTGGVDVPQVLGSRSTLLAAQLGGLAGRALQAGDVLQSIGPTASPMLPLAMKPPQWRPQLRVLRGPQWGNLSAEAQLLFQANFWQV